MRRWHRERKLNAGLSFSCSWIYGGEAAGRIGVRTEVVVLMYRGRGWGISNGSPSSNVGQLLGPHATSAGVGLVFVCPGCSDRQYCGRRVALLYGKGELFACRRCYGLT